MKPTDRQIDKLKTSINNIYPFCNECWAEIVDSIELKEYEKNEYFSEEGEKVKCLGFILNGILRIFYLSNKGEEWNKYFLREGNFVASSILLKEKSITNIQALTKTYILCIPYAKFSELSSKYQEINSFVQKLTFSYLEQKQNREITLLSEDALTSYLSFKQIFPNLENEIQQYHIASYLGITPTQLSRVRQKIDSYQHM